MVTHVQTQLDGVHGLVKGPGELMLPQRLHHHVLHVLQLVGFPETHTQSAHTIHLPLTAYQESFSVVSYLPGLVGLVTSGGGGLVRGGGLGGAASGASDMVDDGDAAMHSGTAASDWKVKKDSFCGPRPGVCAQVCVRARVQFSRFSSSVPRRDKLPSHDLKNREREGR